MSRIRHASPHDPVALIRRWKRVARLARLEIRAFAEMEGMPVWTLKSRAPVQDGWYFSAGIHGDEPGGTEGLICWAEQSIDWLARHPVRIFPCLNPPGLQLNRRSDARGRDLNRSFNLPRPPAPIPAWKKEIAGETYRVALALHEDYDAAGVYIYETHAIRRPRSGEMLLAAAEKVLPIDLRWKIEGLRAKKGLMARRWTPQLAAKIGAESLALVVRAARVAFTVETPSERDIELRCKTHAAILQAVVVEQAPLFQPPPTPQTPA